MRTLEALSIFLLLISSLVFLVHGSPTTESTVPNSDDIDSIEKSTTASVTTNSAPAAPPTPIVPHDKKTVPSETEEHSSSKMEKPKVKSPKLLLYEVEKGIRNLSLEDIEYVLALGNEVFSYALADKLGYLKSGKDEDPHVKAIADNKEILVKKLKDRKEEMKPAVKLPPPPPTTVAPSPQPETPSPLNENRIYYDIVKKISQLTAEDIDQLLDIYDVKTLPYALGVDFGYDDDRDAAHFKYLEDRGGENLKTVLLKEKQRKLAEPRPKGPQDIQPQSSRGDAKELGGGGVKINTPQHTQPQSNRGYAKENWPPGEGEGTRRKVEEVGKGSEEGEKMDADDDRISSPQGTGDNRQGEGNRNDNRPSLLQDGRKDDFDGDNDRPSSFDGDGDEDTWSEDEFEDQLHNVDSDKDQVSNENQSQAGNGEDGGDKGAKEPKENPEKEKDGYARPEDADNKNEPADSGNAKGDAGKESDSGVEEHQKEEEGEKLEDRVEGVMISGFSRSLGAWHFLTMFLLIGVAVVAGYLCVHNREKRREDVGTYKYISDSNKHRRRYKPLIST